MVFMKTNTAHHLSRKQAGQGERAPQPSHGADGIEEAMRAAEQRFPFHFGQTRACQEVIAALEGAS